MKRKVRLGVVAILSIALLFGCFGGAMAYETGTSGDKTTITMGPGENTFTYDVEINVGGDKFASAQFNIKLSDEDKLKATSISFKKTIADTASALISTLDSKRQRGEAMTCQAGFASDENRYGGAITVCTITFKYTGDAPQEVRLDNLLAARFTGKVTDGVREVRPEHLSWAKTISVTRESSGDDPGNNPGGGTDDDPGNNPGGGNGGNPRDNSGGSSKTGDREILTTGEDEAVPLAAPGPVLTDISGHWAESFIMEAIRAGYISGYADHTFRPDQYVTRAEFVKMIVIAFGFTGEGGKTFMDSGNHWAKSYIAIAADKGLVLGSGRADGDYFLPDDYISREQVAAILYRTAERLGITLPAAANAVDFGDGSRISGYAAPAVTALQTSGIIDGITQNGVTLFMPQGNTTRAQAVKMIQGMLALYRAL